MMCSTYIDMIIVGNKKINHAINWSLRCSGRQVIPNLYLDILWAINHVLKSSEFVKRAWKRWGKTWNAFVLKNDSKCKQIDSRTNVGTMFFLNLKWLQLSAQFSAIPPSWLQTVLTPFAIACKLQVPTSRTSGAACFIIWWNPCSRPTINVGASVRI